MAIWVDRLKNPALAWLICAPFTAGAATPAEILTGFRPTVQTEYGQASEVHFSTGPVELESGMLAHHLPQALKDFGFAEPGWGIGYKTDLLDAQGKSPSEKYLCHTFFGDHRVDQRADNEMKAMYSDALTPDVRLPH